jgi:hypothetical protein
VTAREKIDAAVTDLLDRGVAWHAAAPPHYRVLWALGFHIPPMLFQGFPGIFLVHALFFGPVMGAMGWVFERHHSPLEVMAFAGVFGGLAVGLFAAVIYRFQSWRLGLPRWADYEPRRESLPDDADW